MNRERITDLLDFSNLNVLVIGDVMLDEYIFGKADRVSPEAPVPVVELMDREHRLGGAANVALNTSSLGARTTLMGLIGDDANGEVLTELTKGVEHLRSMLVKDVGRKTTCKTRILASNQHLLRVDNEDKHDVVNGIVSKVEKMLKYIHHEHAVDIIVLQDYNKGFFSEEMIQMLMKWAKENRIKTALDPKLDRVEMFKGVDLFKPNLKEVRSLVGEPKELSMHSLSSVGKKVLDKMDSDVLLLTLSSDGIFVMNKEIRHWESTSVQSIVDVSGAGDTVISIAALLYACGEADLEEMAAIANLAGAAVCRLPGVAVVDKDMIMNVIEKLEKGKNVSD